LIMEAEYDYDLFVIGGGSGGLACSKEAAKYGAKVAIADYVRPSPAGTKWGLGGTCVNVGCIPKKLMHYAALLGELRTDQNGAGWKIDPEGKHDWKLMQHKVGNHIKGLNWGYKSQMIEKGVKYFNRFASMENEHTVVLTDPKTKKEERKTAKYIVVAVGGRPAFPDIPGAKEYGISSDDIFWMEENPGKTLCVGASYVSLECAGFLTGIGNDVTVMVRSILLRGFDQECANRIGKYMGQHGTKFVHAVPEKVEKLENGKKLVHWKDEKGEPKSEEFDTVLFAIGRHPEIAGIGLDKAGIKLEERSQKILTDKEDRTNVQNIFAIGDIAYGRLELTPTAIMAGRLLARRLFASHTQLMSYDNIATTVFTPLEYGSCGYAEEDAIKKFGTENIDVYYTPMKPMEWCYNEAQDPNICMCKVLVNTADKNRVIGVHFLGPNAGEVVQGFAVPIRMGLTMEDWKRTIKIHPSAAEEVLDFTKTKPKEK